MNRCNRIGFMQGRLSPMIDGRIQSFPWEYWKVEFSTAEQIDIHLMEWTLDQNRLYENPLLTAAGQAEIRELSKRYDIAIPSLTGDCFMQAPFWKEQGDARLALQNDFCEVVKGCAAVGISMIVVPLVDNGRLESREQEDVLVGFLESQVDFFVSHAIKVIFESDFSPFDLARFISRLNPNVFGINYDIGNSAALGFNSEEEIAAYGNRIFNVHVKDRMLGGTTVPLGEGGANFEAVFSALAKIGFRGNCILQTARAIDDNHAGVLMRYRDMTVAWLSHYAA